MSNRLIISSRALSPSDSYNTALFSLLGSLFPFHASLFSFSTPNIHSSHTTLPRPYLSERVRTSDIVESTRTQLLESESEGIDSGSDHAVEIRRDGTCYLVSSMFNESPLRALLTSGQLVQEASGVLGVKTGIDLSVLDGTKVDSEELAIVGVATEEDGILEVHGKNLPGNIVVGVWGDAVGPVLGKLLLDEEGVDGGVVGCIPVGARWHQLVQEAGGSEEEEGQGAEEEVRVLSTRLVVALQAVLGQVLAVVVTAGGIGHHVEQSPVEAEVVTAVGEEVVAGERRIGFELVVAVEAGLAASQSWAEGGASGRITTNAKLLGHEIAVGQGQTEESKQIGKVVSDVVDILLSIDELCVGSNTIASQEAVVSSDIEAGASSTIVRTSENGRHHV